MLHVALGAIKMHKEVFIYAVRWTSCTAFIVGAGAAAYEARLGSYLVRTPRRVQTAGAGAKVVDKERSTEKRSKCSTEIGFGNIHCARPAVARTLSVGSFLKADRLATPDVTTACLSAV